MDWNGVPDEIWQEVDLLLCGTDVWSLAQTSTGLRRALEDARHFAQRFVFRLKAASPDSPLAQRPFSTAVRLRSYISDHDVALVVAALQDWLEAAALPPGPVTENWLGLQGALCAACEYCMEETVRQLLERDVTRHRMNVSSQ